MDDLYQERLGGANAGDVFAIDNTSDSLTLTLAALGGLQKIAGALSILVDPTGPVSISSNGVDVTLASITKKGAVPTLPDDATKYLDGKGAWTVPGASLYQLTSEKNNANGYAGLNAVSRTTKGVDTTDDVVIDLATKGLVLKDTQGTPHYWRVTITNSGTLTTADIGTGKP
jgi:hypothetical protein